MQCIIVTGSAGLVGSEAVKFFAEKGFKTIGIDNDMRSKFFGKEASTEWNRKALEKNVAGYEHHLADIRDDTKINEIFQKYSGSIAGVIHAAAQPSHDWAAKDPHTDFTV